MVTKPPESAGGDEVTTPAARRLAESRAALAELLVTPRGEGFPRSETMRFVTGGKGRLVILGVFAGLLLVKPKLALGLIRLLPLGGLLPLARILQSLR